MITYNEEFGSLYVIKPTDFPAIVGVIGVPEEELKLRHSTQPIMDARLVHGLLMESIVGYPAVDSDMPKAKSPAARGKR